MFERAVCESDCQCSNLGLVKGSLSLKDRFVEVSEPLYCTLCYSMYILYGRVVTTILVLNPGGIVKFQSSFSLRRLNPSPKQNIHSRVSICG